VTATHVGIGALALESARASPTIGYGTAMADAGFFVATRFGALAVRLAVGLRLRKLEGTGG
jgi:hypothetical protein